MCIICLEYLQKNLTRHEALRAAGEMIISKEMLTPDELKHVREVRKKLLNDEPLEKE